MQHRVAVEGVVAPDRLEERVLGVAEVHPVQVAWDLTLDIEVPGVVLDSLGPPRTRAIGMVVVDRET